MKNDVCGSLWHRWDLHFHTPSSYDYEDKTVTDQEIADRLVNEGVRVVAITDHHTIDVARIRKLQTLGGERLTVLPGIELRGDHGGKPINYICIFPEDCDLDHIWTTFQGSLGLTGTAIHDKGGDEKVYVPIEDGAKLTRELGGVVSIHAGTKSNSIEGIKNYEQFQQRIKYDITKHWVDLMEIGQLKDIDVHLNVIFPETGLDRSLVICSDNHNIAQYSVKAPLWFRADPTFRGLLMVLREPHARVFIGERPPEVARVEQNLTKYIRGLSFNRKETAPASEKWFSGSLSFNSGLVAVIGNKGSGKSALSDTLGLLASTKNADSFSFLSKDRFRHPVGGHAEHFEATIEWHSDEKSTKGLADTIGPEEVERIKYLPQEHVEKVCNELVGLGEEGFERELKSVIFSHVPEAQRLGQSTLDDLVQFQADEKQKRIDSLIKQLREVCRARAYLQSQADPIVKKELTEKISRSELELKAHDTAKPAEKPNPSDSTNVLAPDAALLSELKTAENARQTLSDQIKRANQTLQIQERQLAIAKRLIERLDNFQKDFEIFKNTLEEDATEIGLQVNDLIDLSIDKTSAETIRSQAEERLSELKNLLDEVDPSGLRKKLASVESQIIELQSKLDAPNRAYQAYLKELTEWQERRAELEGSDNVPESLKGLKATLAALDQLPAKIDAVRDQQTELAINIHEEKVAQAEIYRTLYGPVQQFIDSHEIAKDKLKLEFRAELVNEDFSTRLLNLLALNRRGSFMGIDEGRARAENLVGPTKWEDASSIRSFLNSVDTALHTDLRESLPSPVQLKDQLLKGKKPEEVYRSRIYSAQIHFALGG